MHENAQQISHMQGVMASLTAVAQVGFDLNAFMRVVVDTAQAQTAAKGAVVELPEGEWMTYRCTSGLVAPHLGFRLPAEGSLSGLCRTHARSLCCTDAELDARVDRLACRRVGVRSMICTPLFLADGTERAAVLKVVSDEANAFGEHDVQTLDLMAGLLGPALGKQLAYDALQQAEQRMRLLLENASDAIVSIDEHGSVLRWNGAAERLFGLSARAVMGRVLATLDATVADLLIRMFNEAPGTEGRTSYGEVCVTGNDGEPISVEFTRTQTHFGSYIESSVFIHDVTAHKRLEAAVSQMALTDSLTGLANRRKIIDALTHAIDRGRRGSADMALLFMDLNGFKQINDTYGHDAGDSVLCDFAAAVRGATRAVDLIGRLGGDEFVVLAEGLHTGAEARALAEKIVARVESAPTTCCIPLSVSLGISLYQAQNNAGEWLLQADQAMYRAKRLGDGQSWISF